MFRITSFNGFAYAIIDFRSSQQMGSSWKNISFYSRKFLHETFTSTLYYKFSYYNFQNVKFVRLPWNVTLRNWVFHMFLLNVRSHLLSHAVSHYRRHIRRFSLQSFSLLTFKDYPTRITWNLQLCCPLRNSAYISLFQSRLLERERHSFYKIVRVSSPHIHIWPYRTVSCA
jgi:hypothetical protein